MFGSKSYFFKQSISVLNDKRRQVINILTYKNIFINTFLDAYDFFVLNPDKFDGATIVKDLNDIKGLDLSSMKHDYNYIVNLTKHKGFDWLIYKIEYDIEYGKDMEKLGKGIITPYLRVLGLIITTPVYWLYIIFK